MTMTQVQTHTQIHEIPLSPAGIDPNTPLNQLEALQESWLDHENTNQIFLKCREIVEYLGEKYQSRSLRPEKSWKYYHPGTNAMYKLHKCGGPFLPHQDEFTVLYHLIVQVNDLFVTWYTWSNNISFKPTHVIFIPGDWLMPLDSLYHSAILEKNKRAQILLEEKRLSLCTDLLIGKEI